MNGPGSLAFVGVVINAVACMILAIWPSSHLSVWLSGIGVALAVIALAWHQSTYRP